MTDLSIPCSEPDSQIGSDPRMLGREWQSRRQSSKVFRSWGMAGVQIVAGTSALLEASEASVKFSSCTHAQGCSGLTGPVAGRICVIQVRTWV